MRRVNTYAAILLSGVAVASMASDKLFLYFTNGGSEAIPLTLLEDVVFSEDGEVVSFTADEVLSTYECGQIDFMQIEDADNIVEIRYEGDRAIVRNPLAYEGVEVDIQGARVTVRSTTDSYVIYQLSGQSDDAMFKLYGEADYKLALNGVDITSTDGAPINLQSEASVAIEMAAATTNRVADSEDYTKVDGEDMKACLYAEGAISISGEGSLVIVADYKHGLYSSKSIEVNEGEIAITTTDSDAIRSVEFFRFNDGRLEMTSADDGVDGDEGYIEINGGEIIANISADKAKAFKCDGDITIAGGAFDLRLTGDVVVEDGDTSYCSGFKGKGDMTISDGSITIAHTGSAGKGISVDNNLLISGGMIAIEMSGDGGTYTDAEGVVDSYSATCIKVDADMTVLGGQITCTSSGSAGKGISVDGQLVIGDEQNAPTISVTTTGERFFVKYEDESEGGQGGWPGGGGGWPGGGNGGGPMDDNADYANPKAIKAEGDLTVNNGTLYITTTQEGGEGLESKSTLTINGGDITINTYDDAINGKAAVVFNGGRTYCNASGNDGIDSNGTLTVNGGLVISAGTRTPEGGFDCDQNQFKITGGVVIGMGGDSSTPTSSVCTQNSVLKSINVSKDELVAITDSEGAMLAAFTVPQSYSSVKILFSHPDLSLNADYTISKGGTVEGGESWNGYYAEGVYSGGSSVTTFTQSSTVVGGGGRW